MSGSVRNLGLVRFDGVRFEVFDKNNTPGLQAETIFSLLEDRTGRPLDRDVGRWRLLLRKNVFKTLNKKSGLPGDTVRAIAEDASGDIWIGTDFGLVRNHNGPA